VSLRERGLTKGGAAATGSGSVAGAGMCAVQQDVEDGVDGIGGDEETGTMQPTALHHPNRYQQHMTTGVSSLHKVHSSTDGTLNMAMWSGSCGGTNRAWWFGFWHVPWVAKCMLHDRGGCAHPLEGLCIRAQHVPVSLHCHWVTGSL
jgi:hypothetical protein